MEGEREVATGTEGESNTLIDGPLRQRIARAVYGSRARARRQGLPAVLTVAEWLDILIASEGKCSYCAKVVGVQALVLEHRMPVSRGGGTTAENVTPSCSKCNGMKHRSSSAEFGNNIGKGSPICPDCHQSMPLPSRHWQMCWANPEYSALWDKIAKRKDRARTTSAGGHGRVSDERVP